MQGLGLHLSKPCSLCVAIRTPPVPRPASTHRNQHTSQGERRQRKARKSEAWMRILACTATNWLCGLRQASVHSRHRLPGL